MGFFKKLKKAVKSVVKFSVFDAKRMFKAVTGNPEQLLLGAADPLGAKLWGGVLGKKFTPIVNQYGGPTDQAFRDAEAAGIDIGGAKLAHTVAQTVASYYGGKALAGLAGKLVTSAAAPATGGVSGGISPAVVKSGSILGDISVAAPSAVTGVISSAGGAAGALAGNADNLLNAVGAVGDLVTAATSKPPGVPGETAAETSARAATLEDLAKADAQLNSVRKRQQMGRYGSRFFRTSAQDRLGNSLYLHRAQGPAAPRTGAPNVGVPTIPTNGAIGSPFRGFRVPTRKP